MHDLSGNSFDVTYQAGTKFLGVRSLIPTSSDLAMTNINVAAQTAIALAPMTMSAISFSAWFRTTAAQATCALVAVGNTGIFWGALWLAAGVVAFQLDNAVPTAFRANGVGDLRDGGLHFVVGTYDGTTMRVYQNGVQVGVPLTPGPVLINGSMFIGIGAGCPGVALSQIGGTIDEVAIYARALTAAEVLNLWTLGTTA